MMRCDCGGHVRPATLSDFDFSPFAGIPVRLRSAPGLRCDACGQATLEGPVIGQALDALAWMIVQERTLLAPPLSRYLRKYLRLSQHDLAARMGLVRETVAKWECGAAQISPQNDLILRALVVAHLAGKTERPAEHTERALDGVRTAPAPQVTAPPPFIIDALARAPARHASGRHRR
jgi:transcriptional regulator with XRE-family HTH domain